MDVQNTSIKARIYRNYESDFPEQIGTWFVTFDLGYDYVIDACVVDDFGSLVKVF